MAGLSLAVPIIQTAPAMQFFSLLADVLQKGYPRKLTGEKKV
jgi:hypothetical protein